MPDRSSESGGFPEEQLPEAETACEVSQFPKIPIRWSPDTDRLLKKMTFAKITACLLPRFKINHFLLEICQTKLIWASKEQRC